MCLAIGASRRGVVNSASKPTVDPACCGSSVHRPRLFGPWVTRTAKTRPGSNSVTSTSCSQRRRLILLPSRKRDPRRVGPSVNGVTWVLIVCQRWSIAGSAMNAKTASGGHRIANVSWMRMPQPRIRGGTPVKQFVDLRFDARRVLMAGDGYAVVPVADPVRVADAEHRYRWDR